MTAILVERASAAATPWTKKSSKFPYLPRQPGVGPGEEKLAAELGGKIMGGSVSYDIELPNHKKIEVKELDKDGALRTGTEGLAAAAQSIGHILKICDELSSFDPKVLRQAARSAYPEDLDEFISVDVPLIMKGEMTSPRMLGSEKKFGMLQAIKFINSLLKTASTDDHVVKLDKKQVNVDDMKFARAAAAVGVDEDSVGVSAIAKEMAKAKSRAFKDPEWFIDAVWAKAAIPSEAFPAADALVIVSPDGYRVIPRSKLDNALVFTRISQGRPRFKVL